MSSQNGNYSSFLTNLMAFFVVSLYIFEETCVLLELTFHAELSNSFISVLYIRNTLVMIV